MRQLRTRRFTLPVALLIALIIAGILPAAAPLRVAAAPLGLELGAVLPRAYALVAADLAGNGAMDMVITLDNGVGVFRQSTDGTYGITPMFKTIEIATPTPVVADINVDGAPDLVVFPTQGPLVYFNDGKGGFSETNTMPLFAGEIALGDLDGDGMVDLVVGQSNVTLVFRNDGAGAFGRLGLWAAIETVGTPLLRDVDGNGQLDLLIVGSGPDTLISIFLNAGASQFPGTPSSSLLVESAAWIELADLTGDGALDLIEATLNGVNIYANSGQGQFATPPGRVSRTLGPQTAPGRFFVGDINGDGALDLVLPAFTFSGARGEQTQIFLNDGQGSFSAAGNLPDASGGSAADLDGDGSIDLALMLYGANTAIYFNRNANAVTSGRSTGIGTNDGAPPLNLGMGDVTGDGLPDLVVPSGSGARVFRATGPGVFETTPLATLAGGFRVALGDLNGDRDLDLVLATGPTDSLIYLNPGDGRFTQPLGPAVPGAGNLALGDLDGDGDLDLVTIRGASIVYRNDGTGRFTQVPGQVLPAGPQGALGDLDGDGALDLVVSGSGGTRILLNAGAATFTETQSFADGGFPAIGDLDGDGALDLAVATSSVIQLYLNRGNGRFPEAPRQTLPSSGTPAQLILVDLTGDAALDLAVGNNAANAAIFVNDGSGRFALAPKQTLGGEVTGNGGLAAGDLNGDGRPDLALISSQSGTSFVAIALNTQLLSRSANSLPRIVVSRPGQARAAPGYTTPAILDSRVIDVPFRLADADGDRVREVRAFFSLDGGGSWRPGVPAAGTTTTNLPAPPQGAAYTFSWDTFASGVFGQSDNVVVRLVAYPGGGGYAPVERPFSAAVTDPFRVRGTQVRVVDEGGRPRADAVVLRLGPEVARAEQLLAPTTAAPAYTTDPNGYLRGRGNLAIGDTLIALAPVPLPGPYADVYSATVRLYATNIVTTSAGVAGLSVTQPGVQTITAADARPLAIFDLTIALEWDARSDERFMTQLRSDLARASELLFQATHGQAALGALTIFHDKENWDYADIRIYASNRVRPSAAIGGVATDVITDPTTVSSLIYAPGQVRMGAVWNRFGNAAGNLSEDWPRTLVHELAHYLLFLQDNYLGISQGVIGPVTGCPGIMGDLYTVDWQFQTREGWLPGCANTLSHVSTGRADWETIQTFFPALSPPPLPLSALAPGPARLPLAITEIESVDPLTPTARLAVPIFYTVDATSGERVLPSANTRAFLFQHAFGPPSTAYDRLTALGRASSDQVLARGARDGDRLCLFDPGGGRFGCETITSGDEQIALVARPEWSPEVRITPVTSRTLTLAVRGVPPGAPGLRAEVYPLDDDPLPAPVTLAADADGVYSATLTLAYPLDSAYVHLRTDEPQPRWETVTTYALGGNAGAFRRVGGGAFSRVSGGAFSRVSGGAFSRVSGGAFSRVSGGAFSRVSGGGFTRVGAAPVSSAEGDVLLEGGSLEFALGQFLLLQTTSSLPAPPTWATPVSQGYRFTASTGWLTATEQLRQTTMSFSYLDADVPPGLEANIQVYFRGDGDSVWRSVPTTVDTAANLAAIANQGPGLYALMTSVRVQLPGAGWNNFAYPVAGSRPPAEALASIAGRYSLVYGYDVAQPDDPWRIYAPAPAPAWVSDLAELQFGEGYWIYVDQPDELLLKGAAATTATGALSAPPATIYGAPWAAEGYTPAVGQPVEARVGDVLCGTTVTREEAGQVVFVVKVAAVGPATPACGAPDRAVTVTVGGQAVASVPWDNTQVIGIGNLPRTSRVPLPLILR